ncbi:hypothetical protein K3495_g2543 [Podosphaera aphanis]|nr:hypothetical protein K3495_g2543 [Podosphaera aphanis]
MGFGCRFPEFSGPFKVGTIDVEILVRELVSPSPLPPFDKGSEITTIQYRIFYPCQPDSKREKISWLPNPPRSYASSYAKFLGLGDNFAGLVSYIPNPLSMVEIPARNNAALLAPPHPEKHWPLMIFSHGLGGTRNTYSFLAGSIASHGMIVVTPEHRDGSAPISFVSNVPLNSSGLPGMKNTNGKVTVNYVSLPHTPSPEVEAGRNAQLKIRLWELGLVHDSLLRINMGKPVNNLSASPLSLAEFRATMDVETPGRISFAGHSFGAATMTQFVKSTFYSSQIAQFSTTDTKFEPLFTPLPNSSIVSQITPQTPVILLDTWCLPLKAKSTRWLWTQPFPCFSSQSIPGKVASLLAIESEGFYKWKDHLKTTKALLSPDPSSLSSTKTKDVSSHRPHPYFYYVTKSAHLSQSDFGLLFPWITKKFVGCEEPERIIKLNVRAILQLLRNHKIHVSATSIANQELNLKHDAAVPNDGILNDNITIRNWNRIEVEESDEKCAGSAEYQISEQNEAMAAEMLLEK